MKNEQGEDELERSRRTARLERGTRRGGFRGRTKLDDATKLREELEALKDQVRLLTQQLHAWHGVVAALSGNMTVVVEQLIVHDKILLPFLSPWHFRPQR